MAQINAAGLALIKSFEGLRTQAYQDSGGVWTVGFGHTGDVEPREKITETEAEALLLGDLKRAEEVVERHNEVNLSPNQFSALTSFEFNTGALPESTLLRRVNEGDFGAAADEFLRWVYVDGEKLEGLERRREAERALFLKEA